MTKVKIRFINGKMEMDMEGFKGTKCVDTAKAIYEAMKKKGVQSDMENFEKKPEMDEQEVVEVVEQTETAD